MRSVLNRKNDKEMNIWSLDKHKTIKLLLFKLQKQLGQDGFCITGEEGKDFYAITLAKPDNYDVSAYVYIYGQLKELYGIHLEYPYNSDNEYNNPIPFHEDLSLAQITKIVASHFDVSTYEMAI